jgi:SAM-dependent methyltransferase
MEEDRMDNSLSKLFEENLNINLIEVVISNPTNKEEISKIKIRPVLIKDQLLFQESEYRGKQIFHNNLSKENMLEELPKWFDEKGQIQFKQGEIKSKTNIVTFLISKKGKVTIKVKKIEDNIQKKYKNNQKLAHNRKKEYILTEGIPVPFLIDLGVQMVDGRIVKNKYDKFKQINRFLEFIEDILPELPKDREITIIDFGCGKSYLTFSIYYYLKERMNYNIRIIGLDLKESVIKQCNQLSQKYGYDKLTFLHGDITTFEGVNQVDMVVALHACDTATDYALYKAIKWKAKVILAVPCCQHEVNNQMRCNQLDSILKYGLIKERIAALVTDAIRANLLEEQGYKTQIMEFIDMEHTPKNILIRAVKDQHREIGEYEKMKDFFGIYPTLGELLSEE